MIDPDRLDELEARLDAIDHEVGNLSNWVFVVLAAVCVLATTVIVMVLLR